MHKRGSFFGVKDLDFYQNSNTKRLVKNIKRPPKVFVNIILSIQIAQLIHIKNKNGSCQKNIENPSVNNLTIVLISQNLP